MFTGGTIGILTPGHMPPEVCVRLNLAAAPLVTGAGGMAAFRRSKPISKGNQQGIGVFIVTAASCQATPKSPIRGKLNLQAARPYESLPLLWSEV